MNIEPTTKPKPFCFVLMPLASEFNDIYAFGIKGACDDVGVYCERVDEQIFQGSIMERVYNQIAHADVIVADMTGKNPNVFYEVGYAHALGKRSILITKEASDIPFDLKHFPHIVYNSQIAGLRSQLAKRVEFFAFQESSPKQYDLNLEVYWNTQPLSGGNVVATSINFLKVDLFIKNASSITYQPTDLNIGAIVPSHYYSTYSDYSMNSDVKVKTIPLDDGNKLHMLPELERALLPSSYCSAHFSFMPMKETRDEEIDITIRIFSSAGYRDYPLKLKRAPS